MSRFVYDYYTIELPGDMFGDLPKTEWLDRMANHAIDEARERATLYVIPAEWKVDLVEGEQGDFNIVMKVRRKRCKPDVASGLFYFEKRQNR